jgi:hypothetical protein
MYIYSLLDFLKREILGKKMKIRNKRNRKKKTSYFGILKTKKMEK